MPVTSRPMSSSTTRPSGAGSSCMAVIGIIFLLLSFGPLFMLLNGGYSIQGMAWLGTHTGEYGRLFWALASAWTIDVPIAVRAGLPLAQPILPWLMVLGVSFLEIGFFWRTMHGGRAAWWIDGGGTAAALFDYTTTAIGLVFAPFVADAPLIARVVWYILAVALAVPLTFGFEGLLARVLRGR